ncbi:MAG: hypothetical protein CME71_10855 [Halobacteriovorax sp.]|nr:hypothetical protein [Halobacteriovorax sp.]
MNAQLRHIVIRMFVTLLILIVLETLASSLFPMFGMSRYRIPFNVLIVLYITFKLRTPWIPVMVFLVQWFHSIFTVEGWEMGTIAGIIVAIVVSYAKDLMHFSSVAITMVLTQVFQCLWVAVIIGLLALKGAENFYLLDKFWRFIPESLILSFLSPFLFSILDKIWASSEHGMLGDNG